MGMFEQTIEIAQTRGDRTVEQKGWVDTGAVFCQFPASLLESLGYQPNDTRRLRLADGTSIESPIGPVLLRFGRGVFQPVICVFGESEDSLIGAIALETFGLVVDPVRKILAPTESLMLTMLPADDVT
jgi:predicted aspartyl protease